MTQHIVASRSAAARADAGVLLSRVRQRRTADQRQARAQLLEETPGERLRRKIRDRRARIEGLEAEIAELRS